MKLSSGNSVRITECLKSLGLTKYEAHVYIALLQVASATASEIHEISGVPRASVYTVIDQLLEKGLVSVSQSSIKSVTVSVTSCGLSPTLIKTSTVSPVELLASPFSVQVHT